MSKRVKDEEIDMDVYLGLAAPPRKRTQTNTNIIKSSAPTQQIVNAPTNRQNQSVTQAVNVSVTSPQAQAADSESKFDGGLLGYIGINLASLLLFVITLTLATPWIICMRKRWHVNHTIVEGRRLNFTGKGALSFRNYDKMGLSHPDYPIDLRPLDPRKTPEMVC